MDDATLNLVLDLDDIRVRADARIPSSREKSLVLTKIDEAIMWAKRIDG